MGALQRHRYADALDRFTRLLADFPGERAVAERSRVFSDLCRRELAKRPVPPASLEERLTAATAALNMDDDRQAEALAKDILADNPGHDLALYLLATVEARRRDFDAALAYLARAVDLSPEAAAQARLDADFEPLRQFEAFRRLTETPLPSGGSRRGRRTRTGR